MSTLPQRLPVWRRLGAAGWVLAVIASATLGGCKFFGDDVTGAIPKTQQPLPTDEATLRTEADHWARAYDANPGEKVASINYARLLRALTRNDEAVAVMRVAAVKAPKDHEVLGAYGKALADAGQFAQALDVLSRAYPIERPDWTIMSVQGSVEDRLGNHEAAQHYYSEALKIAPGEPSILTNLGLSFALTKQLGQADTALREAVASPRADSRVRQNFALVLALEGKFAEAEEVSRRDMSPEDAKRNVEAIRAMIAQNDTWRALEPRGGAKKTSAPPPAEPSPAG
jgi:Flp pilus assembly protein TadD